VIHGFRKEALLNRDPFWLTDERFSRMVPHLPTTTRGKERVDDRCVISGIVLVLKATTRHNRCAHTFMSALCTTAAVIFCLQSTSPEPRADGSS
jgi:transposase